MNNNVDPEFRSFVTSVGALDMIQSLAEKAKDESVLALPATLDAIENCLEVLREECMNALSPQAPEAGERDDPEDVVIAPNQVKNLSDLSLLRTCCTTPLLAIVPHTQGLFRVYCSACKRLGPAKQTTLMVVQSAAIMGMHLGMPGIAVGTDFMQLTREIRSAGYLDGLSQDDDEADVIVDNVKAEQFTEEFEGPESGPKFAAVTAWQVKRLGGMESAAHLCCTNPHYYVLLEDGMPFVQCDNCESEGPRALTPDDAILSAISQGVLRTPHEMKMATIKAAGRTLERFGETDVGPTKDGEELAAMEETIREYYADEDNGPKPRQQYETGTVVDGEDVN